MVKPKTDVEIAVMYNDISYIKAEVTEIRKKLESEYVSRTEFEPIKKIVYGLISIVLMAVVAGILALVLK